MRQGQRTGSRPQKVADRGLCCLQCASFLALRYRRGTFPWGEPTICGGAWFPRSTNMSDFTICRYCVIALDGMLPLSLSTEAFPYRARAATALFVLESVPDRLTGHDPAAHPRESELLALCLLKYQRRTKSTKASCIRCRTA